MDNNMLSSALPKSSQIIANQFSQSGMLLNSVDERKVRKEAQNIGKQVAEAINKTISDSLNIEDALKKLSKQANKTKNTIIHDKGGKKAFDASAIKEYDNYVNKVLEKETNLSRIRSELEEESNKRVQDQVKILELTKQYAKEEAEALELTTSINLMSEKLKNNAEIRLYTSKAQNEVNEKERRAAQKSLDKAMDKSRTIDTNLQAIHDSYTKGIESTTETLSKAADELKKESKKFGDHVSDMKNALGQARSMIGSVRTITKNWSQEFGAGSEAKTIDRYNAELNDYVKNQMKFSQSFQLGGDNQGFNTLKNDIMEGMTDGVGHIYNQQQIMDVMGTLTEMGFTNNSTAVAMAKDIAYAKEYMGMSSESLKNMYALQVRTGDDNFVKRTLNSIVALQKSGIDISKEQLASMVDNSMTLSEAMMSMGMTGEATASLTEQLTALQVTGDQISPGYGQSLYNAMSDIITGGIDKIAEYGITNPDAVWNQMKQGDLKPMMEALMNSNATNAYSTLARGDYGVGDSVIYTDILGKDKSTFYSQLSPENIDKILGTFDNTKEILASNQDALDKEQQNTAASIGPDYTKMNEYVDKALRADWLDISNSTGSNEYWDKKFDAISGKFDILSNTISIVADSLQMVSSFKNLFSGWGRKSTGNLLKGGKDLAAGGGKIEFLKGLGGKVFGSASTSGTLANRLSLGTGKFAGTKLGATMGGVSIAAGAYETYNTLKDGISVGTKGFKDENGNRIEGTGGFVDGVSAAFTDDKIHDTATKNIGGGTLSGLGKGAAIGAAVGTIIPGIGTLVGGLVGGAIGGLGGLLGGFHKENKRKEQQKLKEMQKQTKLEESIADNAKAIKESRDAVLADRYNDDRWGYGSIHNSAPTYNNVSYGANNFTTTSNYSNRKFDGKEEKHNGIDLGGVKFGTPIGSASNGIVAKVVDGYTWKDSNLKGGSAKSNYVDVYDPTSDTTYRYYHLAGASVVEGQEVMPGMTLGYVGNTGDVRPIPTNDNPEAGTHLHFSVMKNGSYVNPESYVNNAMFNAPIQTNFVPNINTGRGRDKSNIPDNMTVNSPDIIAGLKQINETLILMDQRQNEQQKLLNALTNTPIHDLGV